MSIDEALIREHIATFAAHEQRIDALEKYQQKQNGALIRLDEKYDKLLFWMATVAVGSLISVALQFANLKK